MSLDRFKLVVIDLLVIFAAPLMVLSSELNEGGFTGITWSSVVVSAIGALVAWARNSQNGGLRSLPPASSEKGQAG